MAVLGGDGISPPEQFLIDDAVSAAIGENPKCALQAASNRIASFLTDSGNSAKAGPSTTNGQANSFQQQALPTIAVPTTFTHEAFSGAGSAADATNSDVTGRKLKQVPALAVPFFCRQPAEFLDDGAPMKIDSWAAQ